MKRLTYISKFSRPLSKEEISSIAEISARNNMNLGVTGALFVSGGVFFQIIEGEEDKIEQLYTKISKDDRHTDILTLKVEHMVRERKFPDWSMKTVNLDDNTDVMMQPVKMMLQTITESHRVLEKYTQPSVIKIMNSGVNPLTVSPKRVEKIVMISGITAFSTFTEHIPVMQLVSLLNQYLSICTKVIFDKGGQIAKFNDDYVMAYFDPEQADDALQAALEMLTEVEDMRYSCPKGSPLRALYLGIGISAGTVIEGNIGSAIKMDYTILGEAVTRAAKLQAFTQNLSRALVLSEDVRDMLESDKGVVKLGSYRVSPNQEPSDVFSVSSLVTGKPSNAAQISMDIANYLGTLKLLPSSK